MRTRALSLLLVALLMAWAVPVHAADEGVVPSPVPSAGAEATPDTPEAIPAASPSVSPDPSPSPAPAEAPGDATADLPALDAPPGAPASTPALDAKDRFIVVLKSGNSTARTRTLQVAREGIKADRTFDRAFRGYSAKLTKAQRADLAKDPNVAAIVPDEVVQMTGQLVPTGISRIGGMTSPLARIDGLDERVDADVAIVDTGIDRNHPDLNVVGGVNCSTSNRSAWYDSEGHGTHVAGTVGALDNGIGVVGVSPGVRLWSVRILNEDGMGLLSWYVCGLDWIAAQRDPNDPSRPLIEAVNMSVTKWGSDDHACGRINNDILHQAICRLVDSGVTVVAAAANDSGPASKRVPASYDEVITVSALADTDGRSGGRGGHRCVSWGGYDRDDTFADFSNYGSDVDIIAPGKCIWSTRPGNKYAYLSGTSMAAPHVTGAAALYKSMRPWATPKDVREALIAYGNYDWSTRTDPDSRPDPLLNVGGIGQYGDFTLEDSSASTVRTAAGVTVAVPIRLDRSVTHVERVQLSAWGDPSLSLWFSPSSLIGLAAERSTLYVSIPASMPRGLYTINVKAAEHGRVRETTVPVRVLNMARLAGADRFGTAAAVSAATFKPGVPVVYVAPAYNYPDALAGAAAAGTLKGPVLFAASTGALHPATVAELERLAPARIVVLGGSSVISAGVMSRLTAYTSGPVTRLAGADRFGTAAAVSAATFKPGVPVVYVAPAYNYPDALAGAAAAGTLKGPVLFAASTGALHPATVAELERLAPARIVVLGGSSVISAGVMSRLTAYTSGPVTRLAGADRFGTAAAVSAATFKPGVPVVYVAPAYNYPDALAGAAAAGTLKGPVLFAASTGALHPATVAELERLAPARIVVLGGSSVIKGTAFDQLTGMAGE